MHKIIFKGDMADEFINDDDGVAIASRWEKGTLPKKIDLNGNLYDSASIKAILKGFSAPNTGYSDEAFAEKVKKDREEYETERTARLKLTPEERAKDVSSANLIYVSFHGIRMPKELEKQVVERQVKYYKENPTHSLARPSVYRDLMGKPKQTPSHRPPTIGEALPVNSMELSERMWRSALNTDAR